MDDDDIGSLDDVIVVVVVSGINFLLTEKIWILFDAVDSLYNVMMIVVKKKFLAFFL